MITQATALALAASVVVAEGPDPAAIAEAVAPSIVHVQYAFRFDRGEAPYGGGWESFCASCGFAHTIDLEEVVGEERTANRAGFLIAPNRVVTSDPLVQSRFIESITVRYGDTVVDAAPSFFARELGGMVLALDGALPGAEPVRFDPDAEGALMAVTSTELNGTWITTVAPVGSGVVVQDGASFTTAPTNALIVAADGAAVGLCMDGALATDDSWRGSPETWTGWAADELADTLYAGAQQLADSMVLRVSLDLRSPAQDQQPMYMYGMDESAAHIDTMGVVYDENHVLILEMLKPKITARLERIRVHTEDGKDVEAEFVGSLRDYGAFVARLDEPLSPLARLGESTPNDLRHDLLLAAEVMIQGENRTVDITHNRITSAAVGWRGKVYPSLASEVGIDFLFDTSGDLVVLPIARRLSVALEEDWTSSWPQSTSASDLVAVLGDLETHVDPNNVPLSEADERRLAWLGVELQALDMELARASGVADETNDGTTGAIVTFVYTDSPAERAGLAMGDILLRLHVAGQPKPIDVAVTDDYMFGDEMFPWDRLDEVPEEFFDQIPTPWPSAETSFNRTLTDLGFETRFVTEFARDGEMMREEFVVERGPDHYESAERTEIEDFGFGVRDVTYEARRYFQYAPDEPGVIVAKIEPGSRASIAGLRPYEVITHVNDEPIPSAADLPAMLEGEDDIRLTVKRMRRGRIVRLERE